MLKGFCFLEATNDFSQLTMARACQRFWLEYQALVTLKPSVFWVQAI